ncbi:hypothetical protein BXZ70DRAFT_1012493 [Cristinia sonorae]|uniref:Uncharacterized protein n=1 Tax=Cristinia sonorae TaxID=1940300 RepID=A0A8K0UEF1_9AGAR|nr:hypothetical protein BXZ70DRAFT_1012493 [Cristinia sonorae]
MDLAIGRSHLLVRHELLRKPSLPRYGAKVPPKPVVLMVSPLTDLGACHVAELSRVGLKAVTLDADTIGAARTANTASQLWRDVAATFPSVHGV